MLNIKDFIVKPYQFGDGDKIISCKNPTQELWMSITQISELDKSQYMSWVDSTFDNILYDSDKEYNDTLPVHIKAEIIKDYIEYHSETLSAGFPDSGSTDGE